MITGRKREKCRYGNNNAGGEAIFTVGDCDGLDAL